MLFDPKNDMDLFAALGGTCLLLVLILPPAVAELGPSRHGLALLLCAGVALPTLTNLLRYRSAKLGCAVLPLSFVLCGLAWIAGRPFLERALLLGAPNLLFCAWDLGVRRLLVTWEAHAALGRLRGAVEARDVAPLLLHADERVRDAAAGRLEGFDARDVVPLLEPALRSDAPGPRAAALTRVGAIGREGGEGARLRLLELLRAVVADAPADAAGDAACGLGLATRADPEQLRATLAGEARPEVLVGLVRGFGGGPPEELAQAAVQVAGDPAVDDVLRERAVEALGLSEETPADDPLAVAAAAAAAARLEDSTRDPTPELLWLLSEHGVPAQALPAAQRVAFGDYGVAHAAVEAVEGICHRHEDRLGEASAPVRAALTAGRDALRAAHPPRDNPLADGLIDRIEGLLAALAPSD